MSTGMLNDAPTPYCPGCGHNVVNHSLAKAVSESGLSALDLVVVSDIGCCGLVDGLLNTHTVHGLHGRSAALGVGVRLGLEDTDKKVLVIMGDGGATIGLQHLLEAARMNVDLTVVVLNNLVYGMTGGQISGLTPLAFRTTHASRSVPVPSHDLCSLAFTAGASFVARALPDKKLTQTLSEALGTKGFSLVEILEPCPSHGLSKLGAISQMADYPTVQQVREREQFSLERFDTLSLLDAVPGVSARFEMPDGPGISIVLAGSAGTGVQTAGEILAKTAMLCGQQVAKRGSYPVTVGTGFSISELNISPDPIHFVGETRVDLFIVVTADGWRQVRERVHPDALVVADISVEEAFDRADWKGRFVQKHGRKGALLGAIATWIKKSGKFPADSLLQAVSEHKRADVLLPSVTDPVSIEEESDLESVL